MTSRGNHPDELISASLTGDLTGAERAELDSHLVGCERCRATLAAFKSERRILSGLPVASPPRDLSARVRGGIEAGRFAGPWWRRPGSVVPLFASAAVFAAAVLAVVVFGNLRVLPAGASGSPSASASAAPTNSAVESVQPSVIPTPAPALALGPGELGYLSLNGGPLEASRLTFIDDATGASIDLGTVSGAPIAAALSPDGRWLAYITQKGETGANEVWALHLTDSTVVLLGCSGAASFTDRLAWSSDGTYLAFTLVAADLGSASGCPANDGAAGTADAWVYDVAHGERLRLTRSGNAYSAAFMPGNDQATPPTLLVSFAAERPWTEAVPLASDASNLVRIEGVFLPLISADGSRAIFWNGTMTSNGGSWHFSLGGMPQLFEDFRSAGAASPWIGTPLFSDLVLVGGEGFASGDFAWGPGSDQFAFWNGAWTGAPQSADGTYPSQQDVYFGRVSNGLLSQVSRLVLDLPTGARVMDVAFSDVAFSPDSPGGAESAVTIGLPSAGIGDPPSAYLQVVPLGSGRPHTIGGGVSPPPWDGPAVYGH
jgi:hypothetical protein